MQVINAQPSVLTRLSQTFETHLLHTVAADQRWGVPAGAGRDSFVENKNGWGPRATRGWRITSVGHIVNARHTYGMSVISDRNPRMNYGVTVLNRVSRAANSLLG